MGKYKESKRILLVMLILCAIVCMKSLVNAAEEDGDYSITITTGGNDYWKIDQINKLGTVSYDPANAVLTLNNFTGERIHINATTISPKKLTIKLVGKNRIERSLGAYDYYHALFEITGESIYKRVDVEFAGSGTLDFYSKNQAQEILLAYGCDIKINGPTINFNDCNSGKSIRYKGDNYPVKVGSFTMKSGNVNMEIWPEFHSSETGNTMSYGYAIRAMCKIDISGGNLNIAYRFPRDDYNGEPISYDEAIALACWYEEPKTNNVKFVVDEEIKGKVKLKYERHKITVKCVKATAYSGKTILDVNSVPGITWDESTKTLTFDGYNDGQLLIESEKYREKIKVVIKNKNSMKYISYSDSEDLDTVKGGFELRNVDLEIVGDGSLEIDGSLRFNSEQIVITGIDGGTSGYEPNTLIIDGPHIEVKGINHVENFVMKSGKMVFNESGMRVVNSFIVNGGTLVCRFESEFQNGDGKDKFIILDSECTGTVENCAIICVGYVSFIRDEDLAIAVYGNGEYYKPTNLKISNAAIVYGSKMSETPAVNISRFKVNIPKTEYVYTGKEIRPTVKVGGLIEGEDYTVTYTNNKMIGKANIIVSGVGLYKGNIKITFDIVKKKTGSGKGESTDKSDAIKYKKLLYRVVSEAEANSKYGKVELVGSVNKKCKKITIPKVVKINNKKYRVVSIAKKAFADCKKLKKVIIKSTSIKKIGKKAFAGKKKITVKVPKKKKKTYKKLLKKAKVKCKVL